ncbi:hypothetical protein [Streptomyces niveus]
MRDEVREDLGNLGERLDSVIPRGVYTIEKTQLGGRVTQLETQREWRGNA